MATRRNKTYLSNNFIERDPQDWVDDMLESVGNMAGTGTMPVLYVDKQGNNTYGDGTIGRPYQTITQALGQTSATKLTVCVRPGTYSENLTWPARTNVRLVGVGKRGAVTIDDASSGGTAVVKIYPATVLATFAAYIQNVTINHNGTGLKLDNSSCAGTFSLTMSEVDFTKDGGTSIITNHGTNNPIVLDVRGGSFGGKVHPQFKDTNDVAKFYHSILSGGLVSNTASGGAAVGGTAEITFVGCEVLHEGVSGGSANQKLNAIFCHSRTGQTLALLDTNDLAGSHTENIVGS